MIMCNRKEGSCGKRFDSRPDYHWRWKWRPTFFWGWGNKTYALLRSGDQTALMEFKEDASGQHLVQIIKQSEKESLLDAYQVAVEASPAE